MGHLTLLPLLSESKREVEPQEESHLAGHPGSWLPRKLPPHKNQNLSNVTLRYFPLLFASVPSRSGQEFSEQNPREGERERDDDDDDGLGTV